MEIDILKPSIAKYVFLAALCIPFSLVLYAFVYYELFTPTVAILLGAVFWGYVFLLPLVMDFAPQLARHPTKVAFQGIQGTHYTFDNARVRVFYSEGKVWLATQDIYSALNLPLSSAERRRLVDGKRHSVIPGTKIIGVSETNFASCMLYLRTPEKERFMLWVERSVMLPIHNKAEQGIAISEEVNR